MKGTVIYPGHSLHGRKVDILGYEGDVDLGGGYTMKGPNVRVRRAGCDDGLTILLHANQVAIDVPTDFDPHAPIEDLGAHFAEATRLRIARP